MTTNSIIFIFIALYCTTSVLYVFKFRGNARYADFSEYLRKGWFIFAPFNCFLYLFTKKRAARPIMDMAEYPELKIIQDNWKVIRDEAAALKGQGYFDQTKSTESGAYYDLGFRTFIKYGWSKFYIYWYGHKHESAMKLCPKTQELLANIPSVNGAMFSLLPAGSKLTRHLDPIASSLRLHVSLETPNDDLCYINVDKQTYSWRDGESFMFDETYLHFAHNDSDRDRLILMCDIERPLGLLAKAVNSVAKLFLKLTVVPNIAGDKKGLINLVFSGVTPLMQKIRTLKQTNLFLYKVIKHTVNLSLLVFIILFIKLVIDLISRFF